MPAQINKKVTHELIEIEDRLTVLREKETTVHYKCSDYLSVIARRDGRVAADVRIWRQWYIQWMYNVVDHFRIGRDLVAYAAAYLDRFATVDQSVLFSKEDYTVAAMTSLHMAVKVYGTTENASALCASNLVLLTEGQFVEDDVLRMEMRMLKTFQWKLYPPTAVCFLREYMQLLPSRVPEAKRASIFEIATFIIEISVIMYDYVKYPPCVKAYAALFIALQCMPETRGIPIELHMFEPFRSLKGLVATWFPRIFDELRQSLADRPPYRDLMAKIMGKETVQYPRAKSESGVGVQQLINSPREVIPWWETMLFE